MTSDLFALVMFVVAIGVRLSSRGEHADDHPAIQAFAIWWCWLWWIVFWIEVLGG
jgi:hypothetical protein